MNRIRSSYYKVALNATRSDTFVRSASTGKERDEETGYGYFGARYLDHELMTMWLSVDPMSDKYPNMSPYNYCAGNPIKLVDPDGQDISGIKPPRRGTRADMWKLNAQLDLVGGGRACAFSGLARDQVGVVQFKAASVNFDWPTTSGNGGAGGDISVSRTWIRNRSARKFEQLLNNTYGGIAAGVLGFSTDFEGTNMFTIGLGVTAYFDEAKFTISSSISVTYNQFDKYANQNGGYAEFSVNEQQNPQKVEMNGHDYFETDLMYRDRKTSKMKPTGLKVYCPTENGKPNNKWQTEEYMNAH